MRQKYIEIDDIRADPELQIKKGQQPRDDRQEESKSFFDKFKNLGGILDSKAKASPFI